jgi:hypothetical protein
MKLSLLVLQPKMGLKNNDILWQVKSENTEKSCPSNTKNSSQFARYEVSLCMLAQPCQALTDIFYLFMVYLMMLSVVHTV